jgi:uncharacterized protein (DUF3084 family)
MDRSLLRNIVITLIFTVTVFVFFKYVATLKVKYDLINDLDEAKGQITNLEKENKGLSTSLYREKELKGKYMQENSDLRDYLRASRNRLTKLFRTQKTNEELNPKLSLLKAENAMLAEQRDALLKENENLKLKLSSAAELKKAIRELRTQAQKVGTQIKEKAREKKILEGNRGYIIKDGKPTCYPMKVKIEVFPASSAK